MTNIFKWKFNIYSLSALVTYCLHNESDIRAGLLQETEKKFLTSNWFAE